MSHYKQEREPSWYLLLFMLAILIPIAWVGRLFSPLWSTIDRLRGIK